MSSGIQVLMAPLPGQRIVNAKDPEDGYEDGSVLAYRKDGDEVLFASWDVEEPKGMVWIPVVEFTPDPEAIQPPDLADVEQPVEESTDGTGTSEKPQSSPFGRGGLRRRPGVE
jgi:hypothetical protein